MSGEPETAQEEKSEQEFKKRFPEAEKVESPENNKEIPTTRIHECSDGRKRNEEQYQAWTLKKKQFEKNSDQFINIDDLVAGVVDTPHGHTPVFGKYSINDCVLALGNLQFRFFTVRQEFEYKMQMKKAQEQGLVDANGKSISGDKKPGGIIV